jgi:predicted outer membrane repeat protein
MRVAITLAALLMMLASAPAKAAVDRAVTDETYPAVAGNSSGQPPCLVSNERTGIGARSLQAALDAAAEGDTLIVKGTCGGGADIVRDVTLQGVSNKQFGVATVDGNGSAAALLETNVCCESPDIRISDLTLTNATGPAMLLGGFNGASVVLDRVTMRDLGFGVSAMQWGWDVRITDSLLDNSGGAFGGSRVSGALIRSTVRNGIGYAVACGRCWAAIIESRIANMGSGGVSVGDGGSLEVSDSTISDNAGPAVTEYGGDVSVTRSTITGNSTNGVGGGILAGPGGGVNVSDSTIANNTAGLDGGGAWAGPEGHVAISDSTVTRNVAGRYGGGIYAAGSSSLADSIVRENTASSGGGLYLENPTAVSFLGTNVIADNVPDDCVGSPDC